MGLEGRTLKGMAFTLFGGRVTWDYVGKRPSISATVQRVSGRIAISWPSAAGQGYRVMGCTNISNPSWADLSGLVTATNTMTTWTDPASGSFRQRFYRIAQ